MNWLAHITKRYPWLVIAIFALLTAFFGLHATQIEADNATESLYPDNSEINRIAQELAATFQHSDRLLLVAEGNIFTPEAIEHVRTLTTKLAGLPGARKVTSVTTAKQMADDDGFLVMADLIPVNATEAQLASAQHYLRTSPMYKNITLVSEDGQYASFIIELANHVNASEFAQRVVHEVQATWPGSYALAGQAFISMELQAIIGRDLPVLGSLALAAIVLMLFINFKSVLGMVLSLVQIVLGVVWGMGAFQLLGGKLMALTVIGPIAVMAVGSSFVINMLGRYYFELAHGADKPTAITRMLAETGLGVVISGIAISAAMATFLLSNLQMVRGLGLVAVLGVLAALLASMVLLPALLHVLPAPKRTTDPDNPGALGRLLQRLGAFIPKRRTAILGTAAVVVVFSLFGIPRITSDTSILAFFPADGPTRQSVATVERVLGGSGNITVWVAGDLTNPELLRSMANFQAAVRAIPEIGPGQSIANVLEGLHGTLTGQAGLPETPAAISQELLLYQTAGGVDELSRFVTLDYQQGVINFVAKSMSTERVAAVTKEITALAETHFGNLATVQLSGNPLLEREIEQTMRHDFVISLALAIVLVLFIDSFVRSFRAALATILVLLVTIALQYGLLGWFDLPLNLATMLMGALAIGVGDYAIHLTVRYMEERRMGHAPEPAIKRTVYSAGRQILFTALTLGAGFGALAFASFVPVATLGRLMLITVALVGVATLTLLPAVSLTILRNPHSRAKPSRS